MSEVSAVAVSVAKPGCEEKLRHALMALIAPTHTEAGMIQYNMTRDMRDRRRFLCIERWASRDALDHHINSAHVASFHKVANDWIESNELSILADLEGADAAGDFQA